MIKTRPMLLRLLAAVITLMCCNTLSAQITVSADRETIRQVLNRIEESSGYSFFYSDDFLDLNKTVSIRVRNEGIAPTLDKLFRGTNIKYRIEDDDLQIVLTVVQQPAQQKPASRHKVSGTVSDEKGDPIVGATVIEKGTTRGAVTGSDGAFSMDVTEGAALTVSCVGYHPKEVFPGNKSILSITLSENTLIDEVVVVGYGTQSNKLLTTSVSRLKIEDIETGSDLNPVKMLQGRVAGVQVSSASGKPGSTPNVLVRGVGSISGNSSPLYVVDGIPSESMPVLSANDIERMDVLKDASASAIYGSRANSGVIIITTKSGRQGKTRVDLDGHIGVGWIANDITMANASEYMQVMQAAVDNYNVQMGTLQEFFIPETVEDTDWLNLIYRQPAVNASATVSVSGGNDKTTFYTSAGYNKQEGAVRKSNYDQFNVHAKFEHKINKIFNLKLNMRGIYAVYDQVEDSDSSLKVIRTAREEQPWYGPYNADGSYKVNGIELTRHNPMMLINEEDWRVSKKQGVVTAAVDVTPIRGLKYSPSFSLYGILDEETKKITEKHDARRYNASWAALTEQKNVSHRYVVDNILSYDDQWGKFIFSAMAGHSFEKYQYEQFGAKSDNYADGAYPSSNFNVINAGSNIYPGNISYNAYAMDSYFGRLALNFDNRYILNSTVRRDGCSRFSKDKRYGTFPSVSFSWRITEEHFMPETTWLDDLKLRLSWGKTGSMAGIGNYAAMSLVRAGGSSYNGSSGFRISQDAQNLTWEKASQFNVGLDADLFSGRLGFSFDAFYQKTTDLLFNRPVYSTSGYTSVASNIGSLANKGLEFMVDGKVLTRGAFKWDLSANISFVRNELLSLIGGQDMYVLPTGGTNFGGVKHALINGRPISAYYMLRMDGIYQRDEDVPAKLYAKGVRAGDVMYHDYNKDDDISDDDRMYVGKAVPDYYGGITSSMRWKGLELSVFCQFSVGSKIMSAWRGGGGTEGTDHLGVAVSNIQAYRNGELIEVKQFYNVRKDVVDNYWRGEGTSDTTPRPVMNGVHTGYSVDYNTQSSTRYLEDASYFKIKNITLSYSLPDKALQALRISKMRFYVTLDNFFTFTKYSGYDPEFSYQANPSNTNYGVDYGELPTLRNVIFGVNINF